MKRSPRRQASIGNGRGGRDAVDASYSASIELTVEQKVLTVRAERRLEPQEGDELVVADRPQGTYARQVFLSDTLDTTTCRPIASSAC